ncbi:hypothetical protein ACFYUJ_38865 [Streptomyces sp. NPDC004520]|uniref:hypothetical protein n=1 Tax=Streptomyces sp. NPDC004520 TaxID=3364702 RepID=UPI00367A530D
MNATTPKDPARQEVSALLPALASLDQTAADLEQAAVSGREVSAGEVAAYENQAAHVRHLVTAAGANSREIAAAEAQHRSTGARGYTARGLDHATHTRHFEPTPTARTSRTDREVEEEISL